MRAPEGVRPDEDPEDLLLRVQAAASELTDLVRRINRTNARTPTDAEARTTISDLIAERDEALRMTQLYRAVAKTGTRGAARGLFARDSEKTTVAVVDVRELQRSADQWAGRYREIDVRLQQLNWSTELAD
jgi:hypothetical protein